MPDSTNTNPDLGQDPYAAMLGENVGGVKGFARRYLARKSGADIHAADERQAMRISEGQRAHDEAASAAQYGMDEYFTPERTKYAKSLGVDLGGLQSIAQQRKQLMAEDEGQFAQMSGAQPAAGAAPGATTPAGAPASTGGGVQPASTGPMPPLNADDGQPNWHGHDWAAHAQSEPPEEKSAYDKALFYMNKARRAEAFGLPSAKSYHDMAAFYGKDYSSRVHQRLGFSNASALESQRAGDAMSRTQIEQGGANARHADTENRADARQQSAINEQNVRLSTQDINRLYDSFPAQIDAALKITDPDDKKAALTAVNQRLDAADAKAQQAGQTPQGEYYRMKLSDTRGKGILGSGIGPTVFAGGRVGVDAPEKIGTTGGAASTIIKGDPKKGLPDLQRDPKTGKLVPVPNAK